MAGRREGQHHAGVRLAAEAGIIARHEIEIGIEAERRGLRAGRALGVVGGDADLQAARLQGGGDRGGLADGRERLSPQ